METLVYFLSFSLVLADFSLPEALYSRTICYLSSESIIYPNCSYIKPEKDVIAISSIKTITKKAGCSGQKSCCVSTDIGDCIVTYPNTKYQGTTFDLQKKCTGPVEFCAYNIKRMSTSLACSSANLANEVDFAEIQYYCIKQMNIVNLRQGRYNANNFAIVYLQSFNYHSPNRHFEDAWCEVIAYGVSARLFAIDVHLEVSDSLSMYDKSSCANVYTFPGKYTNFYRLEEVANLTNHFYVHFKGFGVFWIAFKSENRRISMNCGTLNADCKNVSTTSSPKVQKSTQVPWWIAVLGGILVCFLTVLYLYKRHRSKQKIEADQDLEPDDKGLYPSIFSVIPSEKSAPPSMSSFPKNNGLPKYSVSVTDE